LEDASAGPIASQRTPRGNRSNRLGAGRRRWSAQERTKKSNADQLLFFRQTQESWMNRIED